MTRKMMWMLVTCLVLATPVFAQETQTGRAGTFILPVAFAMAIASGLCGLGQGRAIASAAEGMARNPGAAGAIQNALLLGLAFVESLALFTLVIVFSISDR